MTDSIAISSKSLSKIYSDGFVFRSKFRALNEVSFDVQKGQIFGLLGPNGAGKTTFIKVLLGIIRKTSGHAYILGHAAGSRAGRQKVGYLPEHLRIPPHMTPHSALECYGNLSNVSSSIVRSKREKLLRLVGLAERSRDRVKKFSKGMLQRLGLAQALLHDPPLLILDEPTDGLDPRARAEMRAIIQQLADQGVTIFLNSHILQEVEMICDQVAILDRGSLRYCGSVREIGDFVDEMVGRADSSEVKVTMELNGKAEIINESVNASNSTVLFNDGNGRATAELVFENQDSLDEFIDELRKHDVSISNMTKEQISLEEAFLKIVHDPSTG